MTSHGFRSMAATRLNEMVRWHPDVIERALAHQEPNAVRRAYTSAVEYWPERVEMMQVWADYLDELHERAPFGLLRHSLFRLAACTGQIPSHPCQKSKCSNDELLVTSIFSERELPDVSSKRLAIR